MLLMLREPPFCDPPCLQYPTVPHIQCILHAVSSFNDHLMSIYSSPNTVLGAEENIPCPPDTPNGSAGRVGCTRGARHRGTRKQLSEGSKLRKQHLHGDIRQNHTAYDNLILPACVCMCVHAPKRQRQKIRYGWVSPHTWSREAAGTTNIASAFPGAEWQSRLPGYAYGVPF